MAEKEYIEREKLNDMLEDFCVNETFYDAMQTIPAADVAPVVRCKDCKYLEISGCYGECGKGYLGIVRPDCYCCYGERRIDNA